MRYRNLTRPEKLLYEETIRSSHLARTVVRVHDRDEENGDELQVVDGQVDVDDEADITRSCSLSIIDPGHKFVFGPMGNVYADNFISVEKGVYVAELEDWVDVGVFFGPVTGYSREDHEVSIEAQGKEFLFLPPVKQLVVPDLTGVNEKQHITLTNFDGTDSFKLTFGGNESALITRGGNYTETGVKRAIENITGFTGRVHISALNDKGFTVEFMGRYESTNVGAVTVTSASGCSGSTDTKIPGVPRPTNRKITEYIRSVAKDFGETKFRLGAARGRRVPKSFNLEPAAAKEKGTWWYLRQLARSANFKLMYDGEGYLTLRPFRTERQVYTFQDCLTPVAVGFDLTEIRNRVEVYGQDKHGRDVLKAVRELKASHPLSPTSLGRNGRRRVLLHQVKLANTKLSRARADEIAKRQLRRMVQQSVSVEFDHLPVSHVEVGDTCRVRSGRVDTQFRLRRFSLPVAGPASMSVGYTRPQPVAKFKSRRRKTPKRGK